MRHVLLGIGCFLALGGCASWMPSMAVVSTGELRLESVPEGAEARTAPGPSCRTPCALTVTTRGDFDVTFALEGYAPQTVTVQVHPPKDPRIDPSATGSVRFIPNPVTAELQPAPKPPRSRRRTARRPPPPQ